MRKVSFAAHKGGVASVAVSKKGLIIASGGIDGRTDDEVKVWNRDNAKLRFRFSLNEDRAWSTAISADCKKVAAASIFELHVWSLENGQRFKHFRLATTCADLEYSDVYGLCLLENEVAVVGLEGGILQVWDISSGKKRREWKAHEKPDRKHR
jgi:WD40 repeat protein